MRDILQSVNQPVHNDPNNERAPGIYTPPTEDLLPSTPEGGGGTPDAQTVPIPPDGGGTAGATNGSATSEASTATTGAATQPPVTNNPFPGLNRLRGHR